MDMWVGFDVIGLGKIQLKWRVSLNMASVTGMNHDLVGLDEIHLRHF